jgi:hypothetical protein
MIRRAFDDTQPIFPCTRFRSIAEASYVPVTTDKDGKTLKATGTNPNPFDKTCDVPIRPETRHRSFRAGPAYCCTKTA